MKTRPKSFRLSQEGEEALRQLGRGQGDAAGLDRSLDYASRFNTLRAAKLEELKQVCQAYDLQPSDLFDIGSINKAYACRLLGELKREASRLPSRRVKGLISEYYSREKPNP